MTMRLSSSASAALRHARDRLVRRVGLRLQLRAHLVRAALVRELRDRLDRLGADLALRAREERQQRVDHLARRRACPSARTTMGMAFGFAVVQHLHEPRQRLLAADLGQRIDGALADPPVRVARGLDQAVDGALVLRLVQDLDGGAAHVLVLVLHQLQHGLDDASARRSCRAHRRRGCAPTSRCPSARRAGAARSSRCRPRSALRRRRGGRSRSRPSAPRSGT